jgi:hypothetical protein
MSEPNPYQSPPEKSGQPASEPPPTHTLVVARVVEYAIAILLIIALIWVSTAFVITNSISWL